MKMFAHVLGDYVVGSPNLSKNALFRFFAESINPLKDILTMLHVFCVRAVIWNDEVVILFGQG